METSRSRDLVIGSEGFVGNYLSNFLERKGSYVSRMDIKRSIEEDVRFAQIDLRKIDRVFFLAWDVGGAKYLYRNDTQIHQIDWNLRILLNLMPQLQSSHTPFVFLSSQLAEDTSTAYGATKRLGEIWTGLIGGVRLRLWNVYGVVEPYDERSHVVSDMVSQAIENGEIVMLSDGEESRRFIHLEDLSNALDVACTPHHDLVEIYDVTGPGIVKIIDIALEISRLTGCTIKRGGHTGPAIQMAELNPLPNWVPVISLEDGLREMVSSYLKSTNSERTI